MTKKEVRKIKEKEQNGKCFYCGLVGDVKKYYRKQLEAIKMLRYGCFKKGRRGKSLEVERKIPKKHYNLENCVLACYPCNNAKSDVFTAEEFIIIGAVIGALKKKDKLIKLKNNKFIKGLINDVTRATNGKI